MADRRTMMGPAAANLSGATTRMDRDARRARLCVPVRGRTQTGVSARRQARLALMVLVAALLAGCVLPAQPTEPVTAFAQAERYYLETGRALEAARRLMRDYEQIGVLSAEDMIEVQRVWAEARAALDAWWEVLAEAEKHGYQLPLGHTAALLAAQDALARFRAALVAAKATKEIPGG